MTDSARSEVGGRLRVLLVDDDEVDRERVRRALQSMVPVPKVVEADGIVAAELEIHRTAFDCVILDYFLPEGRCIEFLPRLRSRAQNTAFIVLTGQGDADIAVDLMKAGASDYLSKDTSDPTRIHQAIQHAVSLRRAEARVVVADTHRANSSERFRRFVECTPELVVARSFDALAKAGAELALNVFDASETCVMLRDRDHDVVVTRGAINLVPLASWAAEAVALGNGFAHDAPLLAIALRARDGSDRGVIALRTDMPGVEPLLRQLALMISICSDNLVLYDAASRAVRVRDDVLAVVTHDLRAPLNNVRLGASLLRDGSSPGTQSVLDRVERNITHMARLIDDLVDMVRLESGSFQVTLWPESVHELIEAVASIVTDQARDQQLRIVTTPSEDELFVVADRDRVLQVLSNLLSNAMKFTPAGGVVELGAELQHDHVRFGVRDTGCGIASDERERVFVRFWQSDPERRRGLGLGLFIAKGVVNAHGGNLWFESQTGAGSQFFFTLPSHGTAEKSARRSGAAVSEAHDPV